MRLIVRCFLASIALSGAPLGAQRQAATPAQPSLSAETQLALDELSSRFGREFELIQGWFRDRPVLYYNFGFVPEPVTPGRVLWPIHGFDARGNPVALRGQRPIFATIPGLSDYSGVWRLSYVITADLVQPNQLRDVASVEAFVGRGRGSIRETDLLLNLPIVARGSRLARDSTPAMLGWYQGRDVQYFDFGTISSTPVPMWRFARGLDSRGQPALLVEQNSIIDSIPVGPIYPDLWIVRVVRADNAYVPNSLRNVTALQNANMVVEAPYSIRNLPVVFVDGTPVPRAPSPLRAFADLRSPFPPTPTRP